MLQLHYFGGKKRRCFEHNRIVVLNVFRKKINNSDNGNNSDTIENDIIKFYFNYLIATEAK